MEHHGILSHSTNKVVVLELLHFFQSFLPSTNQLMIGGSIAKALKEHEANNLPSSVILGSYVVHRVEYLGPT